MIRTIFCVVISTYVCGLTGCGGGIERFPVAAASGKVMCNGKPVPNVMIFFEPAGGGSSAMVGKPGFAEADEDGNFVLTTYSEGDGAVIGKHNVKVAGPSSEDFPGFKCDCKLSDVDAAMVVEIVEGGENEFTIELPKKKRKSRDQLSDEELEELEDS